MEGGPGDDGGGERCNDVSAALKGLAENGSGSGDSGAVNAVWWWWCCWWCAAAAAGGATVTGRRVKDDGEAASGDHIKPTATARRCWQGNGGRGGERVAVI